MNKLILGILCVVAAGGVVQAVACQGPIGLEGPSGSAGPPGSSGPPGPAGTVTSGDGGPLIGANFGANLISWRYDASQWQVLSGSPSTSITVLKASGDGGALEGDSAFQIANITATNAAVASFGDPIPVDPTRWYGMRVAARYVTGGGTFSAGFLAFDGNHQPIAPPVGKAGFVAFLADGKTLPTAPPAWTAFSGMVNGEGADAGALGNKFPAGTRYIQPIVVTNDFGTNTGTGTTLISSFEFYRLPGQATMLYQVSSAGCGNTGILTMAATCTTIDIDPINCGTYANCAGACWGAPLSCPNTLVGTLLTLP